MGFYVENFHWVLYITGAFTLLPIMGFFNPAQAMQGSFGREPADDIERLVTRHWSLLVGMAGALLIWAGFEDAYRTPIILFDAIEKIAIVMLIFSLSQIGNAQSRGRVFGGLVRLGGARAWY